MKSITTTIATKSIVMRNKRTRGSILIGFLMETIFNRRFIKKGGHLGFIFWVLFSCIVWVRTFLTQWCITFSIKTLRSSFSSSWRCTVWSIETMVRRIETMVRSRSDLYY